MSKAKSGSKRAAGRQASKEDLPIRNSESVKGGATSTQTISNVLKTKSDTTSTTVSNMN